MSDLDRRRLAGELLRRHVLRRADELVRGVGRGRGDAEVGDADVALAVDHHVGRLQVAMQHAAVVRGGDAGAELPRDLHRLVLRQPADPAQQRRQVLAVDVLHRQEAVAVGLAEVVEAADVLVRDLPRDAQLVVEAREAALVGADARRAGTSARPADRASGRRRGRPRPCRRGRAARRGGSGRR